MCIGLTYALTKSQNQPLENLSEVRHDLMNVSDPNQKQSLKQRERQILHPVDPQVGVYTLLGLFGGSSDDLQQEEEDLDDVHVD